MNLWAFKFKPALFSCRLILHLFEQKLSSLLIVALPLFSSAFVDPGCDLGPRRRRKLDEASHFDGAHQLDLMRLFRVFSDFLAHNVAFFLELLERVDVARLLQRRFHQVIDKLALRLRPRKNKMKKIQKIKKRD